MELHRSDPQLVLAICTYRRPTELRRLMSSLKDQQWPVGSEILVIDNDAARSAAVVVADFVRDFPVPVNVHLEAAPGFATVRNAALNAAPPDACVCFIDDDAFVPPGWLSVMWRAHVANPSAIVRSRYLFVPSIPDSADGVADLIGRTNLSTLSPGGTSGLLLPLRLLKDLRFDPYFDFAGGEDLDLLSRLQARGVHQVVAETVVLEPDRVGASTWDEQRTFARWNGRLATILRQRQGKKTVGFRLQAILQATRASAHMVLRFLLRRSDATQAYRAFAASRWSMAFAPIRPPKELGSRPLK